MPRTGPRRKQIAIRLGATELTGLRARADSETSGNHSELIRRCINYALPRMPTGWNNTLD